MGAYGLGSGAGSRHGCTVVLVVRKDARDEVHPECGWEKERVT